MYFKYICILDMWNVKSNQRLFRKWLTSEPVSAFLLTRRQVFLWSYSPSLDTRVVKNIAIEILFLVDWFWWWSAGLLCCDHISSIAAFIVWSGDLQLWALNLGNSNCNEKVVSVSNACLWLNICIIHKCSHSIRKNT